MNKKLLTMGLAALLMAGCSSDDIVGGEGDKGGASAVKGYVGLTIAMPTSAGSRALTYDDGVEKEYTVKDVTLVFSEYQSGKHVIKQVTKFTDDQLNWNKEGTSFDDITSSSVLPVVPVGDKSAKSVLVLVNCSKIFNVTNYVTDPNTGHNTITSYGSIAPIGGGPAFADIEALEAVLTTTIDKLTSDDGGFYMASASIAGAGYAVATDPNKQLVQIEPQKSKEAAMAVAKDNVIYVERGMAKVAVTFGGTSVATQALNPTGTGFTSDEVTFNGWVLDITNRTTFPLRNIDGVAAWTWNRFAPSTATPQRYEWSVDNNYDTFSGTTSTDFWVQGTAEVSNALNAPLYCLENTFNLDHMKQDRTTRAVLRGQYVPNGISDVATNGWFRLGESVTAYSKAKMIEKVQAAVETVTGIAHAEIQTVEVKNLVVGKAEFTASGTNKIVVTKTDASVVDLTSHIDAIQAILGQLTYYEYGYCYYPVRIRHFEDVPAADYSDGVSKWNGETYGSDNDKWLGRYGVVRNNSYVINVTGVSAPGTPTMPDITSDQDDEQYYYIQATIRILSWSKRKQDVNL